MVHKPSTSLLGQCASGGSRPARASAGSRSQRCRGRQGRRLSSRCQVVVVCQQQVVQTPLEHHDPLHSHSNGKSDNSRLRKLTAKSQVMLVRTDGKSCSRELVEASGCLSFAHPSSQQQLLVWKQRPKSVLILKKLGAALMEEFINVVKYLHSEERLNIIVEPHVHEELSSRPGLEHLLTFDKEQQKDLAYYTDFVVCLGGDGVILHASSLFQTAHPPVLAFNMGSLGFLTNHLYRNYRRDTHNVIHGCESLGECSLPEENLAGVHVTLRMRLECTIKRRGETEPSMTAEVLNELVIDRGANPYLTKIECWERNCLITKVQADGVLLATPTGSTAYSVAAGGSMVHPNVPAILFTPICPHSLSFKPVILPDYAEVELRVPDNARCGAWVCFDGKRRQELFRGDSVGVRMSTNPLPTVSRTDQTKDWFASLDRCFSWNDRMEQKAFDN